MDEYTFKEHNFLFLIAVFSGLLSALFFVLYEELKPQINGLWSLLGVCLLVTLFYYILTVLITYPIFKKLNNKRKK